MADKPRAQHHIRPICDTNPAMDTQIYPTAPSSEGDEGPRAQPFNLVPRHPDIRHGSCSCGDSHAPSLLCVLVSRRPGDILFHDQQNSGRRCLNCSWNLWGGLFYAEHHCMHRPLLPLSYSIIRCVVVSTGVAGPHIIQTVCCVCYIVSLRSGAPFYFATTVRYYRVSL